MSIYKLTKLEGGVEMSKAEVIDLTIVEGLDSLTDLQKKQFGRVIMEGMKGKLSLLFEGDNANDEAQALVDMGIKRGILPTDMTFCAVEKTTGEVVAILLFNNFRKTGVREVIATGFELLKRAGIWKTRRLASALQALAQYNEKIEDPEIIAEIYLLAVRENRRDQGIGTTLLNSVLSHLTKACYCDKNENCVCKVTLPCFKKSRAIHLFERTGFKRVRTVKTPKLTKIFGEDYDELVTMVRKL